MKTLNTKIIPCALLSILFLAPLKAQEKTEGPSIEETVEYINKIVSVSLGGSKPESEGSKYYFQIIDQNFSIDKITYEKKYEEKHSEAIRTHHLTLIGTYENISWGELESIKESKYGSLREITIYFNLPLYRSWKQQWENERTSGSESQNFLQIYVLPERVENVKKALLHLKKLMYKEDPFGN